MFSRSLKDLQTDYVDLLLLHYPECWGSLCAGSKKIEGTWQDRWAGRGRAGQQGGPASRARGAAFAALLSRATEHSWRRTGSALPPSPPCSWFALEQLMREKKLRAAGVSNFNLEQV